MSRSKFSLVLCCISTSCALAEPRDVQIRAVSFNSHWIELFNSGDTDQPLDGWQLCSSDSDETLKCTSASLLNGKTIEAGTVFKVYPFGNSCSNGPDCIDVPHTSLAKPIMNLGAYALALYKQPPFQDGQNMVDYIQWSTNGVPNLTADDLADEAVSGGLWSSIDSFIPTQTGTIRITLQDQSFGELHSAADYEVMNARTVQIRSVDFTTGVLEFYNFGTVDVSLSKWTMCTSNQFAVGGYSATNGFTGKTIEAGTSFYLHYNDDCPGGPDCLNITDTGGWYATPLSPAAYGIGLYYSPGGFQNGFGQADYVQWNYDGAVNFHANFRAEEAVDGGTWTSVNGFASTTMNTTRLDLSDLSGAILHGPEDYSAFVPEPRIELLSSIPTSGSIDARQPFDPDGTNPVGWNSAILCFSSDPTQVSLEDLVATVSGGPPVIPVSLTPVAEMVNCAELVWTPPMTPVSQLTVSFEPIGRGSLLGSTEIAYLPGDVNGDGTSAASDVLALIDSLNGINVKPLHSTDIDRSGTPGAPDVLREIDLLNGAAAYPVYNGVSLP